MESLSFNWEVMLGVLFWLSKFKFACITALSRIDQASHQMPSVEQAVRSFSSASLHPRAIIPCEWTPPLGGDVGDGRGATSYQIFCRDWSLTRIGAVRTPSITYISSQRWSPLALLAPLDLSLDPLHALHYNSLYPSNCFTHLTRPSTNPSLPNI